MTAEDFIGEEWLATYLRRLAAAGLTPEEMAVEVSKWVLATVQDVS
jgi:hypothetical protein